MIGVLLSIPNLNFIPSGGFMDKLFNQSYIQLAVLGFPAGGYRITLIGLIIITILAIAVNGITERLTGKKVGSTLVAVLVTILGSALAAAYVLLPFDFSLQGVRIIAALLGAVVISVFWTLFRGAMGGKSGGH